MKKITSMLMLEKKEFLYLGAKNKEYQLLELCMGNKILVLDEATSNLDIELKRN